jgi:hypothetical protein
MWTCPALRPRRDRLGQAIAAQSMLPSAVTNTSAPATMEFFRGSITQPVHSLSTPRSRGRPRTTQDSLPAAGLLCRAGLATRWVPMQGLASHDAPPCPRFAWRTVTTSPGVPRRQLLFQGTFAGAPPPHPRRTHARRHPPASTRGNVRAGRSRPSRPLQRFEPDYEARLPSALPGAFQQRAGAEAGHGNAPEPEGRARGPPWVPLFGPLGLLAGRLGAAETRASGGDLIRPSRPKTAPRSSGQPSRPGVSDLHWAAQGPLRPFPPTDALREGAERNGPPDPARSDVTGVTAGLAAGADVASRRGRCRDPRTHPAGVRGRSPCESRGPGRCTLRGARRTSRTHRTAQVARRPSDIVCWSREEA